MIRIGNPPRLTRRQRLWRWMRRPRRLAIVLPYALLLAVLQLVL
ncbi:hypothetical protein [Catellatospora coxensis]|uniref:Uncharacterized protein n=1 Tax=Catellatospora coxensis TaxID=310354 RepID=A0A8J3PAE8_9ACTN|nr:hypothetical protein [Catellatospora coxensis]GIG10231.1 hypothetical protein Cco03nite_69310 [Catellatospora coxensis]